MKKIKNAIRVLVIVILLIPVLNFAYGLLISEKLCSNRERYESFKFELATIFFLQKLYYLKYSKFTDSVRDLEKVKLLFQEVKQEYQSTKLSREVFTQTKDWFISKLNPVLKISDNELKNLENQLLTLLRYTDNLEYSLNQINFSLSQSYAPNDTLNIVYSGAWKPFYIRIFALKDRSNNLNFLTNACLFSYGFRESFGFPLAPDITKNSLKDPLGFESDYYYGGKCPFGFKSIQSEMGSGFCS